MLDQVARKWAMSVNYDKTIGVVVTPPTAATQGDQPASAIAPPGIQVGPNRVEIQDHFKYLGSITQGNDRRSRAGSIQPARCSSKSQYSLTLHVDRWGHARPQRPRAPATDGPPRLAEAGVGPRAVEGGCQPVLAGGQSVLVDTNLLSFSLVLVLACSF